MIGKLRSFEFRRSSYERPNDDWVCGHSADGRACRLGPSRSGQCRARFECEPVRFEDRWQCTRPISAGGRCEDGPLPEGTCGSKVEPCLPERSWANRRRLAVRWTLGLTIGLLAIALAGPANLRVVQPGPLSVHHSDVSDCGTCHADVASAPATWLASAFGTLEPDRANRGCLSCHDLGKDGQSPHSQAVAQLGRTTERITAEATAKAASFKGLHDSLLFRLSEPETATLSCAACHREHQGSKSDLTWLSNRRCQSCHTTVFESFAVGHPRPAGYPYQRRTRLIFDHARHIDKHFEKEAQKAPDRCESCHQPDPSGRSMAVTSFQAMCADCHIGDIDGTARAIGPFGVGLLSIPGLDLETLEERGAGVGDWPELSDAEVTEFLLLLLAADEDIREDLRLIEDVDLLDLTDASAEEVAAVERSAWRIKEVVHEWMRRGTPFVEERIGDQLGVRLDRTAAGRLTAGLPYEVLLAIQRDYFPDLAEELARYRAGLPVGSAAAGQPDTAMARPERPDSALTPDSAKEAADDELLAEDDDLLEEVLEAAGQDDQAEELLDDEEDLLTEFGHEGSQSGPGAEDDLLLTGEDQSLDKETGGKAADSHGEPLALTLVPPDTAKWARHGGWYRRDHTMFYRPGEHADRFLRVWIDIAGLSFGTPMEAAGAQLLSALTHKDAPGRCTKCHSVDLERDGQINVKWHPADRTGTHGSRASFSHAPHLALMGDEGCLSCHGFSESGDYLDSYKTFSAAAIHSNFKAMDLSVCAECHRPDIAGDDCIQCHAYHFEPPAVSSIATKLKRDAQGNQRP